jgi:hypothetical protein
MTKGTVLICSLMKKAESDNCTTGKSTIGDEKTWNVFMRLDTPEAQYVSSLPCGPVGKSDG